MARDWSEERWIKVFLCDSPRWLALPWQARGLYGLLQRIADRDGVIDTGPDQRTAVAVAVRATVEEVAAHLQALERAGLIVVRPEAIELPEHAEQQASRASGAARQREYRRRVTGSDAVVTRGDAVVIRGDGAVSASDELVTERDARRHMSVTQSDDKKEERRGDKKEKKATHARAREGAAAASDVDPKATRIALELAAHRKFASLDHAVVAEELLGGLGSLAIGLTDERVTEAVATAAAEAESGATERRLRQVLSWKLKDAASGKVKTPRVQGDDATYEAGMAKIYADIEEFNNRPVDPNEVQF